MGWQRCKECEPPFPPWYFIARLDCTAIQSKQLPVLHLDSGVLELAEMGDTRWVSHRVTSVLVRVLKGLM